MSSSPNLLQTEFWQWTRQRGSVADDDAWDLGTDVAGNIFLTGETSGALHGESAGSSDIFLMKFSSDGAWQWSRQRGTEKFDVALGIRSRLLGQTSSSQDIPEAQWMVTSMPVARMCFVMMFDLSGSWQWTEQRGNSTLGLCTCAPS